MRTLGQWQTISFISRFFAMGIGIAQSIFIANILTQAENGLVAIVGGLGASFGVYQNLGLQSSSTREIAAAKTVKTAFKVFLVSLSFRYVISIVLAILLYSLADFFAVSVYNEPRISMALKLYALALLLQAAQGIFNTVLSGLKKFKILFVFQAVIATVSISLFLPLVYLYRFEGYYYAYTIFTFISTVVLMYFALSSFRGSFSKVTKDEYVRIFKNIFSLSLAVYAVKIISTYWQKFGPLLLSASFTVALLGYGADTAAVGVFSIGLFYAAKLLMISDAITDVNLAVFTGEYINNVKDFARKFLDNYAKVFIITTFIAVSAIYWSPELFNLFFRGKFDGALPYIPYLILAFWGYSFVNVIQSSVYVPAKFLKFLVFVFLLMLLVSGGGFYLLGLILDLPKAAALAMASGALSVMILMYYDVRRRLNFWMIDQKMLIFTLVGLMGLIPYFLAPGLGVKVLAFLVYASLAVKLMSGWNMVKVPKL